MDHGFPFDEVYHWPLGMLSDEATNIERRDNRRIASEAVMLQAAASTVMAPKEGGEHFKALIEQLTGD